MVRGKMREVSNVRGSEGERQEDGILEWGEIFSPKGVRAGEGEVQAQKGGEWGGERR